MLARTFQRVIGLTLLLSVLGSAAFVGQTPAQARTQRAAGAVMLLPSQLSPLVAR